ncbi:lipopolysaccharide ABC transporter permease [Bacteroidales bacterium Barb7]|nr:lipopolysaccharide ABC transporter permease [Bacteroidales bacterium Barb7]
MLRLKRLYRFMLQTFLPLFIMTFGICLFIVLMQFIWRYIDDMVGKGLGMSVLAEMFLYAALFLVPMALPLAVLLSSLMTFGNLGERLELLAMKSAGVSLIRIMRPLIILIVCVSTGAFFFQNNMIPLVQVKLYGLLYSMRQKSPELDIPQGAFYSEITGFNVYVKEKEKSGLLKDMMIYDYSEGFNNARVIVADSGRLKTSTDKKFLALTLYKGESFENLNNESDRRPQAKTAAVPYRRESFDTKEILIGFDANFTRVDESFLQNEYMGKNLESLQTSIDSMTLRLDSIRDTNAQNILTASYRRTITGKTIETAAHVNFDSLYQAASHAEKAGILSRARSSAQEVKDQYAIRSLTVADEAQRIRRHFTEWHKKFTVSAACLLFFFIGAPLGAIIRKGGLGVPVIISIFLFIFYYILDNIGLKMARTGVWEAWQGMWFSAAVLAPLGIFLTYKAVNDSVILNADTYLNALKNLIGIRSGRKVEMKEVIIYSPDYEALRIRLEKLTSDCESRLSARRHWRNRFTFRKDTAAMQLAAEMESIVEELGNSDRILILNKLMDYPLAGGYGIWQRWQFRREIQIVQRVSRELAEMI